MAWWKWPKILTFEPTVHFQPYFPPCYRQDLTKTLRQVWYGFFPCVFFCSTQFVILVVVLLLYIMLCKMHAGKNMKRSIYCLHCWLLIAKQIGPNFKMYLFKLQCICLSAIQRACWWEYERANVLLVLLTGLTSWLRPPPVASCRRPKHQRELSF